MRRALSLFFYLLAGGLLMCAPIVAAMVFDIALVAKAFAYAMVPLFGAVPLAIGLAIEPQGRRAAAGLVLMVSAIAGAMIALLLLLIVDAPQAIEALQPPGPMVGWNPYGPFLLAVPMGAIGWLLWDAGSRAVAARRTDIERTVATFS